MGVVGAGGAIGLVVSVTHPLNNRLLVGVAVAALANSRRDSSNEDAVVTSCIRQFRLLAVVLGAFKAVAVGEMVYRYLADCTCE